MLKVWQNPQQVSFIRPNRCRTFKQSRQLDILCSRSALWKKTKKNYFHCARPAGRVWLGPWNVVRVQVWKCFWVAHAEVGTNHHPRLSGRAARCWAPGRFSSVSRMLRVRPRVVLKVHSENRKKGTELLKLLLMDKLTTFSKEDVNSDGKQKIK